MLSIKKHVVFRLELRLEKPDSRGPSIPENMSNECYNIEQILNPLQPTNLLDVFLALDGLLELIPVALSQAPPATTNNMIFENQDPRS